MTIKKVLRDRVLHGVATGGDLGKFVPHPFLQALGDTRVREVPCLGKLGGGGATWYGGTIVMHHGKLRS